MTRRLLLVSAILVVALALGACMTPRGTAKVGLVSGTLRPCPSSPNCVCSTTDHSDPVHGIEPLPLDVPADEAIAALEALVESFPRAKVVTTGEHYLHAEFTSRLFRFVDDVEFLVDAEAGVIHVRSSSRVGYSDLGANRTRVEALRSAWAER